MGLGSYPTISLAEARIEHERCRKLVAQGIDPRTERKRILRPETFREATNKYFELRREGLKANGEAGRWMSPINNHVLPKIGEKAVAQISLDDVVEVLLPIWRTDTGRKTHDRVAQILTNAKARNPEVMAGVTDIKDSIRKLLPHVMRKSKNHPALPWQQMPELWNALNDSVVHSGLKFYLLNLPRTSNVTKMVWDEVDWENGVWDIPPARMKTDLGFSAPLSKQSLAVLQFTRTKYRNASDYVFPSPTAWKSGVISGNTWGKWLEENDWKASDGRHVVPHGFRATFATWCGDNDICDKEMQKRCIQHVVESEEDAAYLRSKLLPQRLSVMQKWADFITSLELKNQQSRNNQRRLKEQMDLPHEKPGKSGYSRTRREIDEWARETDDGE